MLCGIGGKTIAEAQANLSYSEFLSWCNYRNKRGPMNPGTRTDRAVGRAVSFWFNTQLKQGAVKSTIWDFLPYEDEPELTVEDAIKQWG